MAIAPQTHVGVVHLSVADLERSLAWYRDAIGLELLDRRNGDLHLGVDGVELLHLVEQPGATPSTGYSGLFHFALLVPERASLGAWLRHAFDDRVPLAGASDHHVSEALYLRDPDHHGIEIYADRPDEVWREHPEQIGTWPLDLDDLAGASTAAATALPPGTRMGHVHLCVADVGEAVGFYRDRLGFDLITQLGDQAAFLSAGGYHHHLGANVWESRGRRQPPPGTAHLLEFTIVVPDAAERDRVLAGLGGEQADPAGNRFTVVAAA